MSDIQNWSVLASANNQAPPDGWPENTMTFGQINNAAREMMAVMARWFQDTSGVLLATGLHYFSDGNAWGYRLTVHRNVAQDLTTTVRFRIPQINVGPAWLSVNGSHPAWIKWPDDSFTRAGDLADVVEVYWHGGGSWVLNNLQRRQIGEFTPGAGVQMLFAMVTAPTGWVQSAAWHDRLIRVVSHGGTGAGGQWAIYSLSTENANHTHNVTISGGIAGSTSIHTAAGQLVESGADSNVAAIQAHSHTFTTNFGPYNYATTGVSNGHTHFGDGSWRPPYGDVIMCIKT